LNVLPSLNVRIANMSSATLGNLFDGEWATAGGVKSVAVKSS
jgi:hypothetical protein